MLRTSLGLTAVLLCQACDEPGPSAAAGRLLVADQGAGVISAWDARTGDALGSVAKLAPDAQPSALAVQGDRLLVADFRTGDLEAYALGDGRFAGTLHSNEPDRIRLEEPCAMQVRGSEVLVLANDSWNLAVLGPDGDDRSEVGADPPVMAPHGFDVLPDGMLVVGTSATVAGVGMVQVWDPDTGQRVAHFAAPPELVEATAVTALGDDVLVTDWFTGLLSLYDRGGERIGVLAEGLDHPIATQVGPDGELLVLTADAVVRIGPGGPEVVVDGDFEMARNFAVMD